MTGRVVASTAAAISRAANSGSRIRAEPDNAPVTSLAGAAHVEIDDVGAGLFRQLRALGDPFGLPPHQLHHHQGQRVLIVLPPIAARRTTSGRPRAKLSQATISVAT